MTYEQTVDYLFTRLPLFSRIGAAAYKENLDNTLALCASLDNPEKQFRSIHIAGTNGKGSVSHMLAAILQEAGYKTGLYTSPHLRDFRERIRINGEMINRDFVVDFTEKIKPLIDRLEPSFFEITVAMAFDYFSSQQTDIAVIETGLGGRLDSTNVITPELSVITNIGWDHMNLLGNTLEKIAGEKAGIIKKNIPVVVGEVLPETIAVFEQKAAGLAAPLSIASEKRQALDWKWTEHHQLQIEVAEQHKTDHQVYRLDLPGLYQTRNLLTVLEACAQLREKGWLITDNHIRTALQKVKKTTGLHGRWEMLQQHPRVIADVAHNEAGLLMLVEQLELTDYKNLHIVLGMVKDKEVEKALAVLPVHARYYFTQAHLPRALEAAQLAALGKARGLQGNTYSSVQEALDAAKQNANPEDLILVCGSVFLVGELY
ncbi:MAG: bifunctional folylpolyglutamate synthase/dihydrofolate synthase [Chitinophagaceae bacterium]|nr:bifunctional folylpolyglutamate synthase/dihydrofolate synthase [Chitinophagaceae bacterium]